MAAALLALLLAPFACAARPSAVSDYEVLWVEGGDLRYQDRPVGPGFRLPPGRLVNLAGGARAGVRVGLQGHMILVGPAAIQMRGGAEPGLDLRMGGALIELPWLDRFTVATPLIAVRPRTGAVFVDAAGRREAYVCLCRGSARVFEPGGRFKAALESTGHKPYVFRHALRNILQVSAPVERHTDGDLARLAGMNRSSRVP